MKNLIGTTIGQHQITEQLGRGGMANVYKAFHPGLAVDRAIKVIRPDLADTQGFQDRFQREARAVAALRHPNIVQIHDFGQQGDLFYMIMEFVEGEDLKTRMLREGAIRPFSEAVRLIEQVSDALGYAHQQGVVHRDVKPDNVLLNKDGQAILADFGIAKIIEADDAKLTATGTGLGTPAYMAPEQAKGATDVGEMADLYAIGVVLYEMLTAHLPFHADTPLAVLQRVIYDPVTPPREFTADIPDALQGVVLKAMAKDPAHRYPSAAALVEAAKQSLAGGEGGEGAMVPPPPMPQQLPPTSAVTEGGTLIMEGTDGSGLETRPVDKGTSNSSRGPLIAAAIVIGLFLLLGAGAVAAGLWWFQSRVTEVAAEDPLQSFFEESAGGKALTDGAEATSEPATSGAAREPSEAASVSSGGPGGASAAPPRESSAPRDTKSTFQGGSGTTPASEAERVSGTSSHRSTSTGSAATEVASASGEEQAWRQRRAASHEPVAATGSTGSVGANPASSSVNYLGEMRFGRTAYGEVHPEEPVEFSLSVRRSTTFYFDIVTASRRATYTLLAPDGSQVFREEGSDVGPLQVDQPGSYTLRVETDGGIPIQFEVQFKQIGS